jgi:hypothetical protein
MGKTKRRDFLKLSGLTGIGLAASNPLEVFSNSLLPLPTLIENMVDEKNTTLIGQYGPWAASLTEGKLPGLSFRRTEFKDLDDWRKQARGRLIERLGIPDIGKPEVVVKSKRDYDGLSIEELSWQLPYGRPSEATLLKPRDAKGKLPAVIAFHDHGGNKYFGKQKITRISDDMHPMMRDHQQEYYSGFAWANEIARRGYVVIVPDAFPFESRRVWLSDVPAVIRQGLSDGDYSKQEQIDAYNNWAGQQAGADRRLQQLGRATRAYHGQVPFQRRHKLAGRVFC